MKRLRALAAMVMALPLARRARSTAFPETSSAFELGNSFAMLGGRPTASARVNSLPETLPMCDPLVLVDADGKGARTGATDRQPMIAQGGRGRQPAFLTAPPFWPNKAGAPNPFPGDDDGLLPPVRHPQPGPGRLLPELRQPAGGLRDRRPSPRAGRGRRAPGAGPDDDLPRQPVHQPGAGAGPLPHLEGQEAAPGE